MQEGGKGIEERGRWGERFFVPNGIGFTVGDVCDWSSYMVVVAIGVKIEIFLGFVAEIVFPILSLISFCRPRM